MHVQEEVHDVQQLKNEICAKDGTLTIGTFQNKTSNFTKRDLDSEFRVQYILFARRRSFVFGDEPCQDDENNDDTSDCCRCHVRGVLGRVSDGFENKRRVRLCYVLAVVFYWQNLKNQGNKSFALE